MRGCLILHCDWRGRGRTKTLTKHCLIADSARWQARAWCRPGRLLELADRRADGRFCPFHRSDRSFRKLTASRPSRCGLNGPGSSHLLQGSDTICTLNSGKTALAREKRPPSRVRSLPLADAGGGLEVLIDGFSNPSVRVLVAWCFLVVQRLNSLSGLHLVFEPLIALPFAQPAEST